MRRLSPVIGCLFASLAFGQTPILPGQGIPPSGTQNAQASNLVRLQFPNSDVREVLGFYERLTKKRIVVDNQVTSTVNIVVQGEVPKDEAIRIIEINLLLNGFTLIPVENSDIVKVVGTGANPRGAAIPIISDELLLPQGEQVVTYVAKLQYADPTELQQTLTGFLGQAKGGYTNITALPKAQALLITENSATIRGLVHILHEIDVPPAEVISEFIPLERADASDVLEKLKAIFEKQPSQNGTSGTSGTHPAAARPATPGGTPLPANAVVETTGNGSVEIRPASLSEDSIIAGKIKLTADVRTNRIHVVTRPVNMPFIRKLISEFDSSVKFGEPVSRALRYVPVSEVLDVVVKSITEPGMKEEGGGGASGSSGSGSQHQAQSGSSGAGAAASSGGASGGSSGGTDFNVSEGLSTQPVDTTPEARIVGTTKIIADKNANAIIVIGSADVKAKVFRLLDQLDQRIPQVMLHTIIGELDLDNKHQFGVDYIIRNSGLGLSPLLLNSATGTGTTTTAAGTSTTSAASGVTTDANGNPITTTGTSTTGQTASNLIGFSGNSPVLNPSSLFTQATPNAIAAIGGSGLTGFFTAGNSMTAVVTALMNTSHFRVVSRPTVIAKNNKKAIIASGQEVAVPTDIQSALNTTNSSNGIVSNSSVQFKRVALQLEMVPLINSEREVSLDILQKIDEISGTTRIDNNDIPTISTRYVKTSVTVPNESTLVLGGLIKESTNKTKSGVPLLSNIPVLGALFSNTSKEKIRTELIILVRPEVSWTPPEARQLRQRAEEFLSLEPNLEASLYPPGKVLEAPAVPFRTGTATKSSSKTAITTPAK